MQGATEAGHCTVGWIRVGLQASQVWCSGAPRHAIGRTEYSVSLLGSADTVHTGWIVVSIG